MSLDTVSTYVLTAHWIIVIGLSVRVIMRRPPVGVAAAWLTVAFSVPFVGVAFYLLFGEKRLGGPRLAQIKARTADVGRWQQALKLQFVPVQPQEDQSVLPLLHLAEKVLGFPALPGNCIELLNDFESVFDRMVADIDTSRETVHLCFYIWHEGGRAADIVDAIVRAAKRGVRCRALADAFGSKAFLKSDMVGRMRAAGVDFAASLPTGPLRTLIVRADLRNHRKFVIIDDRVAYAGSQNLVDPRFFKQTAGVGEWVDAMVRITGPAAGSLDAVFRLDWSIETGDGFEYPPVFPDDVSSSTGSVIQIAPSGPDLRPEAIHQLLLTGIYVARKEVVMTTPYFVPEESLLTALLSAALRGVQVTLIVPARNNSVLVRYASVAHFDDLMSAGVRIALYNGGLLHTKSLTIDGKISVFGSVNLDMRSLWLDFEISLLVYDRDFTGRLRALQETYLGGSDLLDPDKWQRRPAWHRFKEDTCRLLSPLL
jgi:cardiolipin synthase